MTPSRYVHGARFIRAKHGAWPSTKCRMQVFDFNVHPSRPGDDDRATEARDAAEPDSACEHRLVVEPTRICDDALFVRDVESRLPYREVTRKEDFAYSGFMIDDERIVGLSVSAIVSCVRRMCFLIDIAPQANAFSHGDMRQVDVFTF